MFAVNDKVYTKQHGVGYVKKVGSDPAMTYLVRFKDGTLAWLGRKDKNLQAAEIAQTR